MKITILAALAASLLASTAMAADLLPVKAPIYNQATLSAVPFTWAGLYVGGNVGYGDSYNQDGVAGADNIGALIVGTGAVPGMLNSSTAGWLGGVTVGYNWIAPFNASQGGGPSAVVGFEADFDLSGVTGAANQTLTTAPLGFPASLTTNATREDRWLSTFRGRIGTTVPLFGPGTLFYATGGLALADVDGGTTVTLATPIKALNASTSDSYSGVRAGWTIGGGVESELMPHWTWKIEYLFVDLGSRTGNMATTVAGAQIEFSTSQDFNEHIVRTGVNYKF